MGTPAGIAFEIAGTVFVGDLLFMPDVGEGSRRFPGVRRPCPVPLGAQAAEFSPCGALADVPRLSAKRPNGTLGN